MFIEFFYHLRKVQIPVTLREYLSFLEAMQKNVAERDLDSFYYLARAILVKDEKYFDRFDLVFAEYFKGIEFVFAEFDSLIPEEWLRQDLENTLTAEEKAQIEALGGLEKLLETLKQRLEEQKEKHQGGNKWIGTAGTSPFGSGGYNPEGVRIGEAGRTQGRGVKVWDQRKYRNLDDNVEIGTRNIKVALKRLRKFAREGAAEELDLDDTVRSTARNAGYLDLRMIPERRNKVKVLLFFDVGGSMDYHIRVCEQLFSAARTEFKHMRYFYFHNCPYETVWRDNRRRHTERFSTWDVLHTYGTDYKVIFIGDATMGPYEITHPGGSVEHRNEEAGETWIKRLLGVYPHAVWINPEAPKHWKSTPSIQYIKQLMGNRMYPLTVKGLDQAMRLLNK